MITVIIHRYALGSKLPSHVAPTSSGYGWVGLDGAKRIGAMVLTFTDWDTILEISRYYSPTEKVCPCHPIVTAQLRLIRVVSMSHTFVLCECQVVNNHLHKSEFCDRKIFSERCAHDLASNCTVRFSSDQWERVCSQTCDFLVVRAKWSDAYITVDDENAGVVAWMGDTSPSQLSKQISVIEMFAGGFLGWSHVCRTLIKQGFPISMELAIDKDLACITAYCKSHHAKFVDPKTFLSWLSDEESGHLAVWGDVASANWLHLCGKKVIDIGCLSPPCQPWSWASSQDGLNKFDGLLTLHAWGHMSLIRPRLVCMEMVSAMREHKHWQIILAWIKWCGYEVKWTTVAHLTEMAPQHRDRLLLIAVRIDANDIAPHRCVSWPKTDPFTLQTFQAVFDLDFPWLQQATPNPDVLKMYLDPAMLPKALGGEGPKTKKTKRDVEAYRLRFPQGVAACIMANYSYAHLLPLMSLEKRGLFGSLLITPKGIRFFGIPELVVLFSPTNDLWLPLDGRQAIHMIGNAIAIPHAALALCNALAFLCPDMTQVEVHELIVAVHSQRLHAGNMTWTFDDEGVRFHPKSDDVEATQPIHETFQVTISSPTKTWKFQCEPGVRLFDAIAVPTGKSIPSSLTITIGNESNSRVQMPRDFIMPRADVALSVAVPSVLMVEQAFREISPAKLSCFIVLTPSKIFVLQHDHAMNAREVGHYIMYFDESMMLPEIVSILGERIPDDTVAPTCFIAMNHGRVCQDFEVVRTLKVVIDTSMMTFYGSEIALKEFASLIKRSGIQQLLHAVGWQMSYPIRYPDIDKVTCVEICPIPNRLNMLLQDVVALLISRLFVDFVQFHGPRMSLGDVDTVHLKLKLWELDAWNGLIPKSFSLKQWAQAWDDLARIFQFHTPIRFILHGHQINPDFPIDRFISPQSGSCPTLRIHIVMGLHGGGPTDTISLTESPTEAPSEIPESQHQAISYDLAQQEPTDFDGVVSRMVENWFQHKSIVMVESNLDDVTSLHFHAEDGLLFFKGSLRACMALLQMFEDQEVTEALHRFGWLIAIEFLKCHDPIATRVVLFPRHAIPAVSHHAIKSFLHSCFLTIALPFPGHSIEDCVLVRLKVWGIVVFTEWISSCCTIQRFIDAWNLAGQMLNHVIEVRVVSKGKKLNPDFTLEDYAKTNVEGQCHITLHFVVALRGGGGETKRDTDVHQRNNLASFLLQEKCDLKDVSILADKIVPAAGPQAIQDIFTIRTKNNKWEAIGKLAKALAIEVPSGIEKIVQAQKRTFEKFKKQAKDFIEDVNPKQFTINEGFFLNQDDSPCVQQPSITPQSSGIVILKSDEAQQWITKTTQLSPDELGIVVIGSCQCEANRRGRKVHIPAHDPRGQPLVLSGCFHDIGGKMQFVTLASSHGQYFVMNWSNRHGQLWLSHRSNKHWN